MERLILKVLHVGDGACSILSATHSGGGCTAVIDCGSTDRGARRASLELDRRLGREGWRSLEALVVTHFDQDHWLGLRNAAYLVGTRSRPSSPLAVYVPAVPFGVSRNLPGITHNLITLQGQDPVQGVALRSTWEQQEVQLRFQSMARHDVMPLAGRDFEVLWPPARLDGAGTARLNGLVEEIDQIADKLAQDGYPRLRRGLNEVYQERPFETEPAPQQRPLGEAEQVRQRRPLGEPEQAGDIDAHFDLDLDLSRDPATHDRLLDEFFGGAHEERDEPPGRVATAVDQTAAATGDAGPAFPQALRDQPAFKQLVKRARHAQNALSLVFHDPQQQGLIVFGDATPAVVRRVARSLPPNASYRVMLAPHHGTQRPVQGPAADLCVAQGGRRMRGYWFLNHQAHWASTGSCVNTSDGMVQEVV